MRLRCLRVRSVHVEICVTYKVLRLRDGMGKLGAKKMKKAERLHMARASQVYRATFIPAESVDQIITPLVNNGQLIMDTINQIPMNRLQVLNDTMNNLSSVRESTVLDALAPFVTPVVTDINAQIEALNHQKELMQKQKEAVLSVLEASLVQEFYKEYQYDFKVLFDAITDRMSFLTEEAEKNRVQQQLATERAALQVQFQQELQRQLAAAQGGDVNMAE